MYAYLPSCNTATASANKNEKNYVSVRVYIDENERARGLRWDVEGKGREKFGGKVL